MRWFTPSPDEPELYDWWRPLVAAARRAREERVPWPLHLDEFTFQGRVDRGDRPAIWVYEHKKSHSEVLADFQGRTYQFVPYKSGPSLGRFTEITIRAAIWRAGLPSVVEPAWYDEPRTPPAPTKTEPYVPSRQVRRTSAPRRRHLSLVPPLPSQLN